MVKTFVFAEFNDPRHSIAAKPAAPIGMDIVKAIKPHRLYFNTLRAGVLTARTENICFHDNPVRVVLLIAEQTFQLKFIQLYFLQMLHAYKMYSCKDNNLICYQTAPCAPNAYKNILN